MKIPIGSLQMNLLQKSCTQVNQNNNKNEYKTKRRHIEAPFFEFHFEFKRFVHS